MSASRPAGSTLVNPKSNYRDATPVDPDAGAVESWPDADAPGLEAGAETRAWTTSADEHGQRLDKLLVRHAGEFSRSHLQSLIDQGLVLVEQQPATQASRRLKAGQAVQVELKPTAAALAFRPEAMAIPIVYEDDSLLVVDKPAGWVVHPGAGNWSGTLLNGLLAHHAGAVHLPRAGIVHRLDKGTSGLMVVGKTLPAVTELVRAIAAREVRREYVALAHGRVQPAEQVFEGSIGRDPSNRLRMAVTASGKPARTDVRWLADDGRVSAVACRLHSGRTHQIRVHLARAGHPLVADELYGGVLACGLQRPALHARRLGFVHPVSGAALQFESALPADLDAAWTAVTGAPLAPGEPASAR